MIGCTIIHEDIVLELGDLPFIYASCVGEHGGVTYTLGNINGPDPEENVRLTRLPVDPPEGYYVSNFAFYHGK